MPKFVIYEIWTRSRMVEADSMVEALSMSGPRSSLLAHEGLGLSNWHAHEVDGPRLQPGMRHTYDADAGLNYRQEPDA